jgi:6-pyruvoyltetrahydropterin/6-carboxytetrahydropterin synthase
VSRLATVEINEEGLKFSSGHFMMFSDTQRETMHGHDYGVSASFECIIEKNGMSFDCRYYKEKLLALCKKLDYHFILPAYSEYMRLEETDERWLAHRQTEVIPFLKNDVVVLPICNVTLEELSYWFLQQLTQQLEELATHKIFAISLKIFNARGQAGTSHWRVPALNSLQTEMNFSATVEL